MELENWNWESGRLGNWEIGKLGNWETGKLGNWEIGRLGNWEIAKLGNGIVTWNWAIELGDAEDFSFKMSKFIV